MSQERRYVPSSIVVDDDDDEGDPFRGRDMGDEPHKKSKWTTNSMIGKCGVVSDDVQP